MSTPPGSAVASPAGKPGWAATLAVVVMALAASLAGLANELVQDDLVLLVESSRFHGLGNWREILSSPYWPPPWNQEHYRPLTSLLLALQYGLGGGSALVFRSTSYLLYAGVAVAVLFLAARLLPSGIALAVALLFAAHPVHVEAVAPAVGQSELLVGLFAVLMSRLYLVRRRNGSLTTGAWGLLGLMYVAASLAKEHGMALPALLLAVELFLLPGPLGRRARQLWPGYAFLAALAAIVVAVRMAVIGGAFAANWQAEALQGLPVGGRILTMLPVVLHWFRLLLWPAQLQADYSPRELVAFSRFGTAEALGVLLLLGAFLAIWLGRRRLPVLAFGLAWAALTLLPVSNLVLVTSTLLAERQLFLPSVGFLLAAGAGVAALWDGVLLPRGRRRALALAVALLAAAGVARSVERQGAWRNETEFIRRGAADAPRSWHTLRAHAGLLFSLGQPESGLDTYLRAMALAPAGRVWQVRNELALRLWELGMNDLAAEQLRLSLGEAPDRAETRHYLIVAYLALGAYRAAAAEADTALAQGGAPGLFGGLRALADTAISQRAPPGSIRVRIVPRGAQRAP